MPAALARRTPNRLFSNSGSIRMRLPGVVIITVAWPTNVIATVPAGGRGAGRTGPVEGPVVAPVVILGGGLTGISTAVHLQAPWLLFERDARLGGHARTDERDGFRFDKTGHWLHLRDPAIKQLVDELLPGQMVPIARRARIFSHGVLTRYPYQANLHGLPPEVIKECLLGVIQP